jgi:hypothetical protein
MDKVVLGLGHRRVADARRSAQLLGHWPFSDSSEALR